MIRCFTNSLEEMLNVIGLYYYVKVDNKISNPQTYIFTGLVSLQFMMRNTSPVGWLPLLAIKVFRDGAFVPFLAAAVVVALPIVIGSTLLDSWYYSR